ncbi:unnamed protein product [Heterobilharzia americana]|nr:unnamed protein product [Heterobilharzia americana]
MFTIITYMYLVIQSYTLHIDTLNHYHNRYDHDKTHSDNTNSTNNDTDDALWLQWKILHNKTYSTHQEYNEHRENWQLNLLHIKEHNIKHSKGLELYTTGLNQFSDLNWNHINKIYLTNLSKYSVRQGHDGKILLKQPLNETENKQIPNSWDWRKVGIGECGACWAFSAAGALEGQLKNKTGYFIELSSQQLIDCSHPFGNHGCLGGDMNNAFRYVESNGIQKEENYPYLKKVNHKICSIEKDNH